MKKTNKRRSPGQSAVAGTNPPVATPQALPLDRFLVSRLLVGALSEHEQRRLFVRLLRVDSAFREAIVSHLGPLETEQVGQELTRFETALVNAVPTEVARISLAGVGTEAALERLVATLSFEDLFQLGDVTRSFLTLRMADHLRRGAENGNLNSANRRTRLFLAAMVIDGLEILAVAGVLPPHPRVFAHLQSRLQAIANVLKPQEGKKEWSQLHWI